MDFPETLVCSWLLVPNTAKYAVHKSLYGFKICVIVFLVTFLQLPNCSGRHFILSVLNIWNYSSISPKKLLS